MEKTTYCLFLLIIMTAGAKAQEAPVKGMRFTSINTVGIHEGNMGTKFQLQTVNGLSFGHWSAGIGTGLDYYHMRSVPLVLDIRRSFGRGSTLPFVYAAGGTHFPWRKDSDVDDNGWWYYRAEYRPGLYYDVGAGFRIGLDRTNALLLSAGFTYKAYEEDQYSPAPCLFPPCPEQVRSFDYGLRRLSIKAGWRFH